MKLKIKIKLLNGQKMPKFVDKGEWVDLRANKSIELVGPTIIETKIPKKDKKESARPVNKYEYNNSVTFIPLGIAMALPEGFEAILAPRSSTPTKFGIIVANSFGVIDNSYSGNEDEWKLAVLPYKKATIMCGDRVCQFRIQLSQKATFIQKMKWLFSNGIEFVQVDDLEGESRGGFGSTGTK